LLRTQFLFPFIRVIRAIRGSLSVSNCERLQKNETFRIYSRDSRAPFL